MVMKQVTDAESRALRTLARSRALWNRNRLDLRSDETLAQILDFGTLEDWRALYSLLRREGDEACTLRQRVYQLLHVAPTGRPHFWVAALAALGHPVDWSRQLRRDEGEARL
jgi:hypothetical protein